MVTQDRDWQQELQRLTGPTDNDEGKPTMVVMDGPLVPYNSFDRRLVWLVAFGFIWEQGHGKYSQH